MPDMQKPSVKSEYSHSVGFLIGAVTLFGLIGWFLYYQERSQATDIFVNSTPVATQEKAPEKAAPFVYTAEPRTFVAEEISLPEPKKTGKMSLEEAVATRRTRRTFDSRPLSQNELAQVLWAAQGITDTTKNFRAAPSARSVYPFDLMVVVRNVKDLKNGLYLYVPAKHALHPMKYSDSLLTYEGMQDPVKQAPAVIVFGAVYGKMQEKFPDLASAIKVTDQESGHISQNIYLQAEALGLASGTVGGFDPQAVAKNLGLTKDVTVDYLQTLGGRSSEPEPEH